MLIIEDLLKKELSLKELQKLDLEKIIEASNEINEKRNQYEGDKLKKFIESVNDIIDSLIRLRAIKVIEGQKPHPQSFEELLQNLIKNYFFLILHIINNRIEIQNNKVMCEIIRSLEINGSIQKPGTKIQLDIGKAIFLQTVGYINILIKTN